MLAAVHVATATRLNQALPCSFEVATLVSNIAALLYTLWSLCVVSMNRMKLSLADTAADNNKQGTKHRWPQANTQFDNQTIGQCMPRRANLHAEGCGPSTTA